MRLYKKLNIYYFLICSLSCSTLWSQSSSAETIYDSLAISYDKHLNEKNYNHLIIIGQQMTDIALKIDSLNYTIEASSYLCYAYIVNKKYKEAVSIGKTNSTLAKYHKDTLHVSYINLLNNYSFALRKSSKFKEALRHGLRVLVLDTLLMQHESASHFIHLHNISLTYNRVSDYQKSLNYALLCEQGTKAHLGVSHPTYVSRLNSVALSYKRLGEFSKALDSYKNSLRLAIETKGDSHKDVGLITSNLSGLYIELNQYKEARNAIQQSIKNVLQNSGRGSKYFRRLRKLATIEDHLGNYLESLRLNYEAYDYYHLKDPTDDNYAIAASSLGMTYSKLGQHQRGIEYQTIATNKTREKYGSQHIYTSIELNNLGTIESSANNLDSAIVHIKEAIEIEVSNRSKDHWRYGQYVHNLSSVYLKMKKIDDAILNSDIALEHTKTKLGNTHASYAFRLMIRGLIEMKLQDYNLALDNFLQALEIRESVYGHNHKETLNAVRNISVAYELLENDKIASQYYLRLANIVKTQIKETYPSLNDQGRILFWKSVSSNMDDLLSFIFKNQNEFPELVNTTYNLHHLTKGLSLKIGAAEKEAFVSSLSREILDSLNVQKNDLVGSLNEHDKQASEVVLIENSIRDLESRLALSKKIKTIDFLDEDNKSINLKINDDDLIIDIVKIDQSSPYHELNTTGYFAFVFNNKNTKPELIPLTKEKEFKSDLSKLGNEGIDLEQILKVNFIEPIGLHKRKEENIIVSPAGEYHYLPYSSIPILDTSLKTATFSVLLDLNKLEKTDLENLSSVSIFGNPNFDISIEEWKSKSMSIDTSTLSINDELIVYQHRPNSDNSRSSKYFNPLPGTSNEINGINNVLATKCSINIFEGKDALEDEFKNLNGRSSQILHIATHGFSFKKILADGFKSSNLRELLILSENPMLRSGLAFTGANNSWLFNNKPKYMDDGILTAYEISRLDLSNCSLVVLSACESGIGEATETEGVFGLQRAFKIAGVDKMIVSLWKIPDNETSELMINFYKGIAEGKGIKTSFYDAQKTMAINYDPFYWAGFNLIE